MENWNSFLTENKKQEIADLKFGELKNKKHKKRIAEEPKIIDIPLSEIPITKFPPNNSAEVKKELKTILDTMVDNKDISKKELETADKKPTDMFTKYLKDNDIEYDKEFIKDVVRDVSIIALRLKVRYGRPRPEQLGHLVGYDIRSIKTETDDTPSYPSGHTLQAWTLAYYFASENPDSEEDLFDIAEKIEKSRIIRGAHYPSDNKESKNIAKKYFLPKLQEKRQ